MPTCTLSNRSEKAFEIEAMSLPKSCGILVWKVFVYRYLCPLPPHGAHPVQATSFAHPVQATFFTTFFSMTSTVPAQAFLRCWGGPSFASDFERST